MLVYLRDGKNEMKVRERYGFKGEEMKERNH